MIKKIQNAFHMNYTTRTWIPLKFVMIFMKLHEDTEE